MLSFLADLTVPAAVCLTVSVWAACVAPCVLLVDADLDDVRSAVRRAVATVHQGAVHAGHDFNRAVAAIERRAGQAARDTAVTVAALLILTIPTGGNQ